MFAHPNCRLRRQCGHNGNPRSLAPYHGGVWELASRIELFGAKLLRPVGWLGHISAMRWAGIPAWLEVMKRKAPRQGSALRHNPRILRCVLLATLAVGTFAAHAFADDSDSSGSSETPAGFQWRAALSESFLAFTIAHAERFPTEAGTRESIQGPFWKNYIHDLENLHGWEDGDGFVTSYIAHPMEGAMAGFIERQNDPKYRSVEFGWSQRYWISTVRSLAFSTAYNIVWSLSPYGEAGLGNVDIHASPGVVDPAASEMLGMGWMIGEDAIDRYLIKRIENKYRNPVIRAFARGGLNPIRSYANLLRFKVPWHRDSRPGVYAYTPDGDYTPADELIGPKFKPSEWPNTAFELLGQPYVQRNFGSRGSTCVGGGGEAALRMSNSWAMVFDVDGCTLLGIHAPDSGDMLSYMVGPRWSVPPAKRWIPYAQVLVGGAKITHDHIDVAKKALLTKIALQTSQPEPEQGEYTSEVDTNGFSLLAGGGVSYRISDLLVLRVAHLAYQRSWVSTLQDSIYTQGLRFSFGLAVRLGPWREPY